MTTNMNNQITGGVVSIEDGLKAKEEFAPARKVRIELNFSVPENGDGIALLDYVTAVANGRLQAALHGKAPADATAAPAADKPATTRRKPAADKAPATAGETTKADLAAAQGLPTTDTQHKGTTPPLVEKDELEDDIEAPATPAAKPTAAPTPAPEDELGDLLGTPEPITDKDLGSHATKWVAEQRAKHGDKYVPTIIRDAIAEYAGGAGKPMSAIPAAKRHEFVEKLKTLQGVK